MRPTLKDVAKIAGVSDATVSNVINHKPGTFPISEKTRGRVWEAVKETGYRPNFAARSLATGKTNIVACLVRPEYGAITNSYYSPILAGMESVLLRNKLSMLIESGNKYLGPPDPLDPVPHVIMPDAFAIIGNNPDYDFSRLNGKPTIFISCNADYEGCVHTRADNFKGARLATEHLLSLGHRNIVVLRGPDDCEADHIRYSAINQVLRKHAVAQNDALVHDVSLAPNREIPALRKLVEQGIPFTGVLAFNDTVALNSIRTLREQGLRVPEDVSVVGFDDIPYVAEQAGLTTIEIPAFEIGSRSAEALVKSLQDPSYELEDMSVDVSLKDRQTTAPVKQG